MANPALADSGGKRYNAGMSAPVFYGKLEYPLLGTVFAATRESNLVRVSFSVPEDAFRMRLEDAFNAPVFFRPEAVSDALTQIREYLDGERSIFNLPLDFSHLTDFRRRVLAETLKIPYGETSTYGEIARRAGSPHAARAVGGAMAANPIPIIIPCHRVLAADGTLHGYAGGQGAGLETKARLLKLEGARWKGN